MLSFPEFRARKNSLRFPRYNNFHLYFNPHSTGYCEEPFFVRFSQEHSDLEESIRRQLQERNPTTMNSLRPIEPELYLAYLIMKIYGASDSQLFT